jgi:hypothetical protein
MSNRRVLNVLRKLKYRLNRNYLEKIYLTFIRPVLEYASEVWDNCGQILNVKLHSTPLTLKIIISVLVRLNFNNHLFDHFFSIVCQYTFYLYRDGVGKVEN